ncbi:hypothetical protein L207DRAFT_606113 [Hyaloscypha variabilis F]|uniref:AB hydrolase-1 domain-containing protein n=1 Tax=Hyaloscypha variabilis (strain UAMH 11265 / GT02V1 / F) TaxID=1149755 RepID=A0A2J6S8G8_HYAVF|nr:hypothetical protein L207DRAFT_606113 [Hyaloscypha variabilis F]
MSTSLFFLTSQAEYWSSETSLRVCYDYSIPVNVTNMVLASNYTPFTTNYDVADFSNGISGRDGGAALHIFSGLKNITGVYTISASICSPRNRTSDQKTILVASHGLGYDRKYWDSGIQPANYSFVDFAVSQGYSVFFYDRLGTGESTKVSGYEIPQSLTQLAILQQLTILLRSGTYTGDIRGKPSKIAHVGHSFGSFISNALIATTPQLSDAAILTGIGYSGLASGTFVEAFGLRIAAVQAPGKWPGRDNEYVTWVDASANVAAFFIGGSYDEEVLWYTEDNKQPMSPVELLTIGGNPILPIHALDFTAPVMVLSGEFDFAFCGGDCNGILSNGGKTQTDYFPNATDFQTIVHPGVAHGINFSYNATGAYKVITDYLKKNGL